MTKTYVINGITIETTAEIIAVHIGGETYTPQRKVTLKDRIKHTWKQYWRNNYFRRQGKAYVGVKVAEIASRLIGAHQLYVLAQEYVQPHLPTVVSFIKTIDWPEFALCVDVGFAAGVVTTYFLAKLKRYITRGKVAA